MATIKKITVCPRMYIKQIIDNKIDINDNKTWALISIYSIKELISTPQRIQNLKEIKCIDYLSLKFSDIEKEMEGEILFNEHHAKKILYFINKIKDKAEILIIHCEAGISRSGAVGLFLCRAIGLNEGLFWLWNPRIYPNNHVLDVLDKISPIDTEYKKNDAGYQRRYKRFKSLFKKESK